MARNAILLTLAASTLSACITVEPGSPGRAIAGTMSISDPEARASRDEIAPGVAVWPRRWGDEIADRQDDSIKGVIVPVEGPLKAWQPRRHGPWHARLPRGNDTDLVAALANGRAGEQGYRFRMEGNGAFVFERDPDIPAQAQPVGRSDPAEMFVFVSGRIEEEQAGDLPRVGIERTWFAFYDHRRDGDPSPDDPGVGTVMLLPGLFGIPEQVIDVVTATMRQRGWNVIRMLAPPSRFVEKVDIEIDPDEPETAHAAAKELMHRVSETAYAAQAAWEHVRTLRPATEGLPKVAFGGSGGALALPAVVRRDPTRYDAAVVIAGGANILEVVTRSSYTKPVDALEFAWKSVEDGALPADGALESAFEEYLRHAPLDGFHAGAWLGGMPTLIVQAAQDRAVPTANSELLWKRLGEPEKWTIQGNHLTLFLSLWLHTPKILDWVDDRVLRDSPAEGEQP